MFARLLEGLKPLLSARFLKFGFVGGTGVVVNLTCLMIFAELLRLNPNLSSAMAIEISVVNNFLINEHWTFRDRRDLSRSKFRRFLRFNTVSLGGAGIQWSVFVTGNVVWLLLLSSSAEVSAYFGAAEGGGWFNRYVLGPVFRPPQVGMLKYLSQLTGIGIGLFWNFLINFHWTWRVSPSQPEGEA